MAPIYKINIKKIGCIFKRILLKNRVEIFLFFYFILMFIFYSWTTITNSQSFIHVDDREIWLVSHNIYKNHSLTYEEPLNKYLKHKVFNTFETVFVDNKIVPRRALGIYFLTASGFLFGENGPFLMISILGLLCVIFFYLLTKNLFDKKIALLSTVLLSSSFPIVHWSNMLFNNMPAFSLYIIGLFFFSEILVKKKNKIIFYLLSSIFFSLSIWIRYEYLIFVLLLIVWILKDRKSINFKYLVISTLVIITILFPILLLNNYLYKSPFLVGYSVKSNNQVKEQISYTEKQLLKLITRTISGMNSTFKTFLSKLFKINTDIVFHNFKNFIFNLFPQIVPFALFGIIHTLKSKNKNIINFTIYAIFVLIFWMFYIMRGYHFGGKDAIAGASKIRYLFITYSFVIVFSTFLIFKLFKRLPDRLIHFVTILIIIISIINTVNLSFFGTLGMVKTHEIKKNINMIDTAIKGLPSNSIIVNDTFNYAIGIRNRKVFDMSMIYSPAIIDIDSLNPKTNYYEVVSTTIKYIKILLDLNYPVYVLEKNHFNLVKNIEEKEELLDTKKVISEDYFEIYKVSYKEK